MDTHKKAEQLKALYNNAFEIKVELLEDGVLPCKAHRTDAGFDLFATEDITVAPGQVIKHPLNIKMHLPMATYASIESKSGLGARGLLVYAGVIDEGFRGVPHVVASNLNAFDGPIEIKKGQKIAQMIVYPFNSEYFITHVEAIDSDTDRGAGGFGSSGE